MGQSVFEILQPESERPQIGDVIIRNRRARLWPKERSPNDRCLWGHLEVTRHSIVSKHVAASCPFRAVGF